MSDMFDLRDRVAVITGGFGNLAQRFALALVARGARVAALDVADGPRAESAAFSAARGSGHVMALRADVRDRAQLEAALARIEAAWCTPHLLINNAAIDSPPDAPAAENGPFETYPEASLDLVIDVNLKGAFLCCQVFGGAMARAGRGSVINIASIYGLLSPVQDIYEYKRRDGTQWFKPAAYAVTKAALLNLTRYLATYWGRRGVRVNTLSPAGVAAGQDAEFLAAYTSRMPMGRMAEPHELDGAIVFLASDASTYVTGANLVVDGGWTAW